MNFKTTYILFGVLIGLLVIFALTQQFSTKPGMEGYVMSDLQGAHVSAEDIDTFEIDLSSPKAEKVAFVRDSETKKWKMTLPFAARTDSDKVNDALREVISARKEEKADLTADLEKFGLRPPSAVVVLKQGMDRQWQLNLGRQSEGGNQNAVVYVTSSSQPKMPMAVQRKTIDSLFKPVNDFRSRDLLAQSGDLSSAARIQSVELAGPVHAPVQLDKSAQGGWRFVRPPFGDADYEGDTTPTSADPKPITGVRELIAALDDLRVDVADDFVAENVTDFAKYGLDEDKPERLRIQTRRGKSSESGKEESKDVQTITLLVGKNADDKGAKVYVRLVGEQNVAKISAKKLEGILKVFENPAVLRNRDLTDIETTKVDAIDIHQGGTQTSLRKPAATWQMLAGGKTLPADDATVQGLLTALTAKRQVQSWPDPAKEKELGFDSPQAVVALWVEGLAPEEKKDKAEDKKGDAKKDSKDDKKAPPKDAKKDQKKDAGPKLKDSVPTVRLVFGKKDNADVYVRREAGSDKMLLAVPAGLLAKVMLGPLAYRDRTLPSFADNADVTDVILEQSGQTVAVHKEQKDDKSPANWKFRDPKDLAGHAASPRAVAGLIESLRGMQTDRLVAENPSAKQLDGFGLTAPAIKAIVKINDKSAKKTEDWTYSFGNQTDDKAGRYARVSKSDLVFLAGTSTLTALQSELQDPTIFHFDVQKVKALRLTGWKQSVSNLELEKKGASWVVKSPPDFELDTQAVLDLLGELANLKAMRFVVRQGGPKPEHKLGPTDRALQVELTLEGEKAPLILTLGALDAKEKAYYAQSSTLPGDFFLLPLAIFEPILSGPKHFSKKQPAAPGSPQR
jgi:hypothetical protein